MLDEDEFLDLLLFSAGLFIALSFVVGDFDEEELESLLELGTSALLFFFSYIFLCSSINLLSSFYSFSPSLPSRSESEPDDELSSSFNRVDRFLSPSCTTGPFGPFSNTYFYFKCGFFSIVVRLGRYRYVFLLVHSYDQWPVFQHF